MFQPYVFFANYSHYTGSGKGDLCSIGPIYSNSLWASKGERVAATSLDRPKGEINNTLKQIHRVPSSVERVAATSLDILTLTNECKEINRKNAPNELSIFQTTLTTWRVDHGA